MPSNNNNDLLRQAEGNGGGAGGGGSGGVMPPNLESNPSEPLKPPPTSKPPSSGRIDFSKFLRASVPGVQGGGRGGALGELGGLAKMLLERGGSLPGLPEDLQAQLDQILSSELADTEASFDTQKDDLVRRLFGQGLQRSTIAGDVGGRLVEGEARALSAVRSAAAQRALQLRTEIANRNLQAAGIAANALGAKLQGEVGFANVAAQNARTGAMVSIAAMENQTRLHLGEQQLALDRDRFDFSQEAFYANQDLQRELARLQADTQLELADKGKPSALQRIFGGIAAAIPFL